MNMQQWIKRLLIAGTCTAVLAGCGSNTTGTSTSANSGSADDPLASAITIKHDMGETVLKEPAKNVVVLEWSFADDLLALGMTPTGIADDNKPEAMNKLAGKSIEYMPVGERETPDLEKIAGVAPDLIIADTDRHSKIKEQLDQIAPTIVLNSRKGSYKESMEDFEVIAKAVGKEDEAKQRIAQHNQIMANLKKQADSLKEKRVLIGVARKDGFNAHTTASYAGAVLQEIGLDNVVKGTSQDPYPDTNLETITSLDPDMIFIATDDSEAITNEWKKLPVWNNLKAVKNNHVYMVDRDIWTRFRGITPAEKIGQNALDLINGKVTFK
ncbi:ABC transporter substrate-binding protein [Paenibacillus wulumuqiensis]|uniref:ABC transporter substrate-binding protein n=1 Tax=Paenibacillus wulumuqiensis TaxID=1567107 RepID=UPI000696F02E|nr:Fe(3+) dicitrate ABC transporter substrate-binding protein [Paenibacillus wulumuqiensis]